MRSKTVILLVLLVVTAVAVVDVSQNGAEVFTSFLENMLASAEQKVVREPATAHAARIDSIRETFAASELQLTNGLGNVTVLPSENGVLDVKGNITVFAQTEDAAGEFLDKVAIEAVQQGDIVRVGLDMPSTVPATILRVGVEYTILAPPDWKLAIENRHGPTSVTGFRRGVELNTSFGTTTVSDITGMVQVYSRHGSLRVSRVNGNVDVRNEFDTTDVRSVSGDVIVFSRHGNVAVEDVDGSLKVTNSFDDVDIRNVTGPVSATVEHGHVYVTDVDSGITADTRFGNISVYTLSDDARLSTYHGNITVRLGSDPSFTVDARARQGSIDTSFGLAVDTDSREKSVTGQIGTGASNLYLRSEFGDIQLH